MRYPGYDPIQSMLDRNFKVARTITINIYFLVDQIYISVIKIMFMSKEMKENLFCQDEGYY